MLTAVMAEARIRWGRETGGPRVRKQASGTRPDYCAMFGSPRRGRHRAKMPTPSREAVYRR